MTLFLHSYLFSLLRPCMPLLSEDCIFYRHDPQKIKPLSVTQLWIPWVGYSSSEPVFKGIKIPPTINLTLPLIPAIQYKPHFVAGSLSDVEVLFARGWEISYVSVLIPSPHTCLPVG